MRPSVRKKTLILYLQRSEGRGELISVEDCVKVGRFNILNYGENSKEKLMEPVRKKTVMKRGKGELGSKGFQDVHKIPRGKKVKHKK